MKSRGKFWRLVARYGAPFLAGGVALQVNLSGCDAEVRETVLTGIQDSLTGLMTSVIEAFFLSLQDAESTSQVTKATFEALTSWLA